MRTQQRWVQMTILIQFQTLKDTNVKRHWWEQFQASEPKWVQTSAEGEKEETFRFTFNTKYEKSLIVLKKISEWSVSSGNTEEKAFR